MKFHNYCLMAMLCPAITAYSQVKTLSIGDPIADVCFKQVINASNTPVAFHEFNGKTVILDFFQTNCSFCIHELKRLWLLQQQLKATVQIIVVTSETNARIKQFLATNSYVRGNGLLFITNDTLLHQKFPHRYIPHEVWIKNNQVVAITGPEYVTAANIQTVNKDTLPDWPVKIDAGTFQQRLPLLGFVNPTVVTGPQKMFYSAFTSYLQGVPHLSDIYRDTVNGTKRWVIINQSILGLYSIALWQKDWSFLKYPANRKLQVKDSANYVFVKGVSRYSLPWDQQHAWCYEAVFPMSTSEAAMHSKLASDLDIFFGLHSSIETGSNHARVFVLSEQTSPH